MKESQALEEDLAELREVKTRSMSQLQSFLELRARQRCRHSLCRDLSSQGGQNEERPVSALALGAVGPQLRLGLK